MPQVSIFIIILLANNGNVKVIKVEGGGRFGKEVKIIPSKNMCKTDAREQQRSCAHSHITFQKNTAVEVNSPLIMTHTMVYYFEKTFMDV